MDSGELEERVSALEGEVRDLKERVRGSANDAAAARVLAGAADRDVSEFRAEIRDFRQETRAEFQAVREETRAEFGAVRQEMAAEFGAVRQEMAAELGAVRQEMAAEFTTMRRATAASFNAMRQDFVDLRTHVDEGFEKVDRGFTEMRGRLDATAAGQQQIVDLLQTIIRDGTGG